MSDSAASRRLLPRRPLMLISTASESFFRQPCRIASLQEAAREQSLAGKPFISEAETVAFSFFRRRPAANRHGARCRRFALLRAAQSFRV